MAQLDVSPELLDALRDLSGLLESDEAVEKTLQRVVDLSVRILPGCDAAGVSLSANGSYETRASSDEFALRIDNIQYETGEGPCLEAAERRKFIQIESILEESRWPAFAAKATEAGVGSSISFPLTSSVKKGALNIYSRAERAFDHAAIGVGQVFAAQASVAVANAQLYVASRRLAGQLTEALENRDVIGQAKGILMEREGVNDSDAFEMLRNISQTTNVKLRDIAARLVADHTEKTNST